MVINHNMSAMYAQRQTGVVESSLQQSIEKLSSGQRINRAGDDASGLAVSEKMRSQIRGLNQAGQNIQNGVSFIQATEGYLTETTDIIQRLRELSIQASNGIYSAEDRMQIQVEVSQLVDEVNRIASHAQFNGMNILTGRFARDSAMDPMQLHVGANVDQNEQIFIGTMTTQALGITGTQGTEDSMISLSSVDGANMAIATLDSALKTVSKQRADLGAYQNRFEMAYKGISIASENLQAAESRIRDTDMAQEMVSFTKNQILSQAGNAMIAQANTQPQSVLRLISSRPRITRINRENSGRHLLIYTPFRRKKMRPSSSAYNIPAQAGTNITAENNSRGAVSRMIQRFLSRRLSMSIEISSIGQHVATMDRRLEGTGNTSTRSASSAVQPSRQDNPVVSTQLSEADVARIAGRFKKSLTCLTGNSSFRSART